MVEFIKLNEASGVFAGMGLGKSVVSLTATAELVDEIEVLQTLVIAPLRPAKHTWTQEIEAWAHINHLTTTVLAGKIPKRRLALLKEQTDIHIINRELVPWLVKTLGKNWHYDHVIIDESHSFKNGQSKRFKALKRVRSLIRRIVALTGTPTNKSLMDLWSQVYLLDQGERLGRTFSGFRDKYFTSDYMGYNWTLRDGAKEAIENAISDICISLKVEDYLDMPDLIENPVEVELSPSQYKQYQELEREFLLEVEDVTITAVNAGVLTSKLSQAANGSIYTGEDGQYIDLHTAKLDALDEIIENLQGEPVIIVYRFQFDLAKIRERYPDAVYISEDDTFQDRWNNGEIDILIMPASGGEGLNIQHGGHTMIWFGPTWDLGDYLQVTRRLYRQGQQHPVVIHTIVTKDTIDQDIIDSQADKDATQKDLLEAVKYKAEKRSNS